MINKLDGRYRDNLLVGLPVSIVLKKDQTSGVQTTGIIKEILTNSSYHPHGIKVKLNSNQVGRVKEIFKYSS